VRGAPNKDNIMNIRTLTAVAVTAMLLLTTATQAQSRRCDDDGCYDTDNRGRSDRRDSYRENQQDYNRQRGYPDYDYRGGQAYRNEQARRQREAPVNEDGPDE
jgi:hypothetical protein